MEDRAGKHSCTENDFSGNWEMVNYREWGKRKCKPTKNIRKREEQKISPKKGYECKEIDLDQ